MLIHPKSRQREIPLCQPRCAWAWHPSAVCYMLANHSRSTDISSTSILRALTPSPSSLSFSRNCSPSTRSIAGAPSRVASLTASLVKVPVVMSKPLSARPTIAPRKSRTCEALTVPCQRLHWKMTWKLSKPPKRIIPLPSMPPSPLLPVTSTCVKPDSRSILCASRSNAAGDIFKSVSSSSSRQLGISSGSSDSCVSSSWAFLSCARTTRSTSLSSMCSSLLTAGESAQTPRLEFSMRPYRLR